MLSEMHGDGRKIWRNMFRTIIAVIGVLLAIPVARAQYDGMGADEISRFRPGSMWFYTGLRPAVPEKVRKYDRLIFDLTYSDWMGDLEPLKNDWRSIGLNTNLMFDIPITKGNTVSFGTGLAHSVFRISSPGHIFSADSTGSYTTVSHVLDQNNPDIKRYLGGQSVSIPFEFRFRSRGWKHVKLHLGGKIGYQFTQYAMVVTKNDNGRFITKDHSLPDPSGLIYSAHVRFGIRNWSLYASYNLNKLFTESSSPQLNLIQAGLSISLF